MGFTTLLSSVLLFPITVLSHATSGVAGLFLLLLLLIYQTEELPAPLELIKAALLAPLIAFYLWFNRDNIFSISFLSRFRFVSAALAFSQPPFHLNIFTFTLQQEWANYALPEHFVRPTNTFRNFHMVNKI